MSAFVWGPCLVMVFFLWLRKRELVAVVAVCVMVPWDGLQSVIMAFPGPAHLVFYNACFHGKSLHLNICSRNKKQMIFSGQKILAG